MQLVAICTSRMSLITELWLVFFLGSVFCVNSVGPFLGLDGKPFKLCIVVIFYPIAFLSLLGMSSDQKF